MAGAASFEGPDLWEPALRPTNPTEMKAVKGDGQVYAEFYQLPVI